MGEQGDGEYWFDEKAADAAAGFFPRHLTFTAGEWAGRPFVLEGWQEHDIIRPLFGWKRADGTRRYRRVIVWVPRKNGKTELAAGVALLALIGDGLLGGQVFSIAVSEDQARLVFTTAAQMVVNSQALSAKLETLKTAIYCPELNAGFRYLTGKPRGKHGLKMSGLIGDEVHEWPDDQLYTFVHQSSASQRQPIEMLISTAGISSGYGWELWQECLAILADPMRDPETLVVVYAAGKEDDWTLPETWAKANPNLGVSVKIDYLRAECNRARELPRLENDFRRYHLNQWVEQSTRWISMPVWDENRLETGWDDPAFEDRLVGRRCYGGLDLSTVSDMTALAYVFPPVGDERWAVLVRPFVPSDAIEVRSRRDRAPYDIWAQQNALVATPGNAVDYDWIFDQAQRDAERFDLACLAVDRWNAEWLVQKMREIGIEAMLFGQGYASLSAPTKQMERLLISRMLDHGGHPVARWCAGNVAVATDPAGNIKPDKKKSTERIDVIAAIVNALGAAMIGMEDDSWSHGGAVVL